jgi:hypothetical protein
MPITYMVHPEHGAMHAYDSGEVKRLEGHGWKVAKEPTAAELQALKAPKVVEEEVDEPVPKKRGPKPKE